MAHQMTKQLDLENDVKLNHCLRKLRRDLLCYKRRPISANWLGVGCGFRRVDPLLCGASVIKAGGKAGSQSDEVDENRTFTI